MKFNIINDVISHKHYLKYITDLYYIRKNLNGIEIIVLIFTFIYCICIQSIDIYALSTIMSLMFYMLFKLSYSFFKMKINDVTETIVNNIVQYRGTGYGNRYTLRCISSNIMVGWHNDWAFVKYVSTVLVQNSLNKSNINVDVTEVYSDECYNVYYKVKERGGRVC